MGALDEVRRLCLLPLGSEFDDLLRSVLFLGDLTLLGRIPTFGMLSVNDLCENEDFLSSPAIVYLNSNVAEESMDFPLSDSFSSVRAHLLDIS